MNGGRGATHTKMASAAPPGPSPVATEDYVTSAITDSTTGGPWIDINTQYLLASAYLVFFMHCGFAMISIGCVRARFARHIAVLILIDACASALGFYLFGFAFAFGDETDASGNVAGNPFIGSKYFALNGLDGPTYFATLVRPYAFWVFEWAFAATACTIVSGAIAERARVEAYAIYSFFMAAWVYPVVVHSVWSSAGWASMFRAAPNFMGYFAKGSGAIDFAGSGAVHMVGGYAAAAGCWIIGPRIGRFNADGTANDFAGHNSSLFVLGVMILWFGWYGFNPGSQLVIVGGTNSFAVSVCAVTTTLAPAAAGLSSLLTKAIETHFTTGKHVYDVGVMGNGALAGLVAITSGTSTVYPWGAIIIGLIAGALYVFASRMSILMKLDDPLDAIAVHGWNGTWGVIAVGFFAGGSLITNSYGLDQDGNQRPYGCFFPGGDGALLAAQIAYALWIAGWVLGNMIPMWLLLKYTGLLRATADEEALGLDSSHHGGSAYVGGDDDKSMTNGTNGASVTQSDLAELKAEIAALKKSAAT
ncbi:Ammonium transporter 1 member 1 [Coccomyxa sp. Obi]|nr:Ammonium transporter 1 member 1 [Coccomyxa sp. Obi]